jgi:hypothetical protein
VAEDYRRDVAETRRVPFWSRRASHRRVDQMVLGEVLKGRQAVVHWEGRGRLRWWRMRRRFRRRYGVVAVHVNGNEWRLSRPRR